MTDRLWTATLTGEQLAELLRTPREAAPFAILERVQAIDFPAPTEAVDPDAWDQGRVFGRPWELRWERHDGGYRAWLAGETEPEGDGWEELPRLQGTRAIESRCFLYGRDEMRLERPLEYRALGAGSGRPVLVRRELRDARGNLVLVRFTGMEWET